MKCLVDYLQDNENIGEFENFELARDFALTSSDGNGVYASAGVYTEDYETLLGIAYNGVWFERSKSEAE